MVASDVMNARATSLVANPHTVRNVNATLVSRANAGWQQVKISRS
jgi:hypothetical protein